MVASSASLLCVAAATGMTAHVSTIDQKSNVICARIKTVACDKKPLDSLYGNENLTKGLQTKPRVYSFSEL